MTALSQQLINERLRDKIGSCPCCEADRSTVNEPDDGIPDGMAFEIVFTCGARIFVEAGGLDYDVGQACPQPLKERLDELYEEVVEQLEEEFPDDEGAEDV